MSLMISKVGSRSRKRTVSERTGERLILSPSDAATEEELVEYEEYHAEEGMDEVNRDSEEEEEEEKEKEEERPKSKSKKGPMQKRTRRCSVEGCGTLAQSRGLCLKHGGGK